MKTRTLRINDNTWKKCKEISDKFNITVSDFIRMAIIEKLDRMNVTQETK